MSLIKKIFRWLRGEDHVITFKAALYAKVIRANGQIEDLGKIASRVVTTAGVNYLVDALQNLAVIHNLRWHASGTGVNAENIADTVLQTEVESRTSGTQTEGASANIFRTVGVISYTATRAITEHGIFSASSTGTLWDRSVFSAINVVNGDSIQFTYDLTCNAGG